MKILGATPSSSHSRKCLNLRVPVRVLLLQRSLLLCIFFQDDKITCLTSFSDVLIRVLGTKCFMRSRLVRVWNDTTHPNASFSSAFYAVVTCQIKLYWNNLSVLIIIIIITRNHVWKKLFQNYFSRRNYFKIISEAYCSSWIYIFQHVQCRWNYFETISELFWRLKEFRSNSRRGYTWNVSYFGVLFYM